MYVALRAACCDCRLASTHLLSLERVVDWLVLQDSYLEGAGYEVAIKEGGVAAIKMGTKKVLHPLLCFTISVLRLCCQVPLPCQRPVLVRQHIAIT
jgi:hypothetical protein